MPDNKCPECAKVVLNGGIAARVLDETCYSIQEYLEQGGKFTNITALVVKANQIEESAFEFSRMVLEGQGFAGPWPKSMA